MADGTGAGIRSAPWRSLRSLRVLLLVLVATPAAGGVMDDIGHTALLAELGAAAPTGAGVVVEQVEAGVDVDGNPAWFPDPLIDEFAGKTIVDVSGAVQGVYSAHASSVGRRLYGSLSSIAPAIDVIQVYEVNGWLGGDLLQLDTPFRPAAPGGRVGNHSWIGSTDELDAEALRRLDWLIDTQESSQIVGVSNGAPNPPLLAGAYNVVAVGVTDGEHGVGTAAVDAVYTAGRSRPHLVVPVATTSVATPIVAAAAALLIETGHSDPGLSSDPVEIAAETVGGALVYNAERSTVVKAALMAGARRRTSNSSGTDILDYRLLAVDRAPNGLDRRFGAGQLDVQRSHGILAAGEQTSVEDGGTGEIAAAGFDYDPAFGGAAGSNAVATYYLMPAATDRELMVALVWNLAIDAGGFRFDGTASPVDLDLVLFDVTDPSDWQERAASRAGAGYNSEHLWLNLAADRVHALRVQPAAGQAPFDRPFALAWHGRDLPAADADDDGVSDWLDNCSLTVNPDQVDADADGYGNPCDADLNNDGRVNFSDLASFRSAFGGTDAVADLDRDGIVNFADLAIFRQLFGRPPGPSGQAP